MNASIKKDMICSECGFDWTGFTGEFEGKEVPLEELLSSIDRCPECPGEGVKQDAIRERSSESRAASSS